MERVFLLKGLTCPNCSAKIEREVGALSGVSSSSINLVTQTLTVSLSENYSGDVFNDISKIVHNHESDVEVIAKGGKEEKPKKEKKDRATIIRLVVGAVIFAVGISFEYFTSINQYITLAVLILAYIILGADVVLKALRNITKGRVFDENFLMTVSTIGAFVIGEYPEAVAVMLFYQIGEFFQGLAVKRSRKSISSLMDIRPDSANVVRNGAIVTVSPEQIAVGETIVVKPGEKIPLDGIVLDGNVMLDTRALTGEAVPRSAKIGDVVLSGCINQSGVLTIEVTKAYGDSTASKIIDLVENAASRKAPTESFITAFSRYYTPIVVGLAALLAVIPPLLFGGNWAEWINRGFVFLVISCPCALVISIPLTFFGGIGSASRKGVLVKGGNYLEALNNLETVVFDKTGTLTKGVFRVSEINAENSFTAEWVLRLAAAAESLSNHPIARSIIEEYGKEIDEKSITAYNEISGHGISAKISGKHILVGNDKLMRKYGIDFLKCEKAGTVVYVGCDGSFAGSILISDEIKPDSCKAIAKLKALGVKNTVMLTGDNEDIAKAVSQELGIDKHYSQLLPAQKVEIVERLDSEKSKKGKLAFVGDGINDAPVLARADIGIAMGALGSDAAIEAADVVLMTDEPSKLIDAVKTAKATRRIVMQNIIFALGVKAAFLVLGAFGIAGMWEAVFGDVGVMLLAVLNSMRILRK
ncbi:MULTISPECIES: heavy metal translocating P-type ATPase [unclassified Ruminococcus]|uniref:heavy metal translocating P-type ATPase n=1 Tax=unclassified Ruminococcus TaxID=2608920 RepID=UPI00210E7BF0|nr:MULTISPECIES: heavy metal translocating P-type ATPase [unclassified Ruminococcus]MCQ4022915.1 cadmium-translocating P-type ATPase [Ruminococcus sp. zg-924]MCQ4115269.1 cadmium-translocating P-type ATPase [Ruminococcus sp. zg-921]